MKGVQALGMGGPSQHHRRLVATACRLPNLSAPPAALVPQQRLLRPSSRPAGLQQPQADERGASQHAAARPRLWPASAGSRQQLA